MKKISFITGLAMTVLLSGCLEEEQQDEEADAAVAADAASTDTDTDMDTDTDTDTDSDTDTDTDRDAGPDGAHQPDASEDAGGYEPVDYADTVVDSPGPGTGVTVVENAVNGVRGEGQYTGGFDVFSLGYDVDQNNYITLRWSDRKVTDGPGTDFVVFENAFENHSGGFFMDHLIVYVSNNENDWVEFPHDYVNADEGEYEDDPVPWEGFAGKSPVLFHEENNPVDPFDQAEAGGDHFDIDDIPDDGSHGTDIRENGFMFIRLVTAPSVLNPDTGKKYVKEAISNGADIDGVYARYLMKDN